MKFECGKRKRLRAERVARRSQWHTKLAWLPVKLGAGDCRWLERVEMRLVPYTGTAYFPGPPSCAGVFAVTKYRKEYRPCP